MRIRIAGYQAEGIPADVDANLEALAQAARAAVDGGAQLLITSELFVTGYNIPGRVGELARLDLVDRIAVIAQASGVAIIAGLPEPVAGGVSNSAVFIDETGTVLGRHQKTHLYGDLDRGMFIAGDRPVSVVEYRGVSIAMLICYDVEFAENVRAAALAGAHLIAVPTAQMVPFEFTAESLVRVRAWENQVYVAYINHDGYEGDLEYVGRSSIVDPGARILDSLLHGDGLIFGEIDTELVDAAQAANPFLADTRPALYVKGRPSVD